MYFPSKKDSWFILLVWGFIILFIVSLGYDVKSSNSFLDSIILFCTIGFLLWLWFGTGYQMIDGELRVRSGPFKKKVQVCDIKQIRKLKNILSAPALSIDRLELHYSKYDVIYISPKNEAECINVLLKENPRIKLDEKLKKYNNLS